MGLSASQSRLLTLTSRLSDLELKAQKLQHQKVRLAEQSTEAAKTYMNALDAQNLLFNSAELGKVAGSIQNITSSGLYRVADVNGNYFYSSDRTTNTTQVLQTPAGNTLTISSNGTMTYQSKYNTTKIQDGVITTITANGTIMADGDETSNNNLDAVYLSANRNISVMGNSLVAFSEAQDDITVAEEGKTTNISASAVSKKFTSGDKLYSYSVTSDNVINLANCTITKDSNGVYTIDTTAEKYCTIDVGQNQGRTNGSTEYTTLGSEDKLALEYLTTNSDGQNSTGNLTLSVSGNNLVIVDGDITYSIGDGKISVIDNGTTVVNNDTIPVYNTDAQILNNGASVYTINDDGTVRERKTSEEFANGSAVHVGLDTTNTKVKADMYETWEDDKYKTGKYKTGSKIEYKNVTIGDETGNALVVTNVYNKSSITALSNGFAITEPLAIGSTVEATTKIYKSGDKIYVEEEGETYVVTINKQDTKVHAQNDNKDFAVSTIPADSWVLRNDDGTFKTVKKENMTDAGWLLEQLQSANLFIQKYNVDTQQWGEYSYVSSSLFTTEDDDSGLAKAEAEYEAKMAEIQHKDKSLDLELDNIETEHTAIDTQIDSVKGIVEKNIDKSFKIFG